ncbi:glycoside hydrolase, family 47 [Stachybotrys elegans]|uniref:alpha-1,2-Mannosidase n=1 Tax=Stachybotrys elegans TaxID=80388 RepID=A0A8K0WUJ1_9HYPO|nr:glycoside hydrolase, family 47 [Stachybotrys elegans]
MRFNPALLLGFASVSLAYSSARTFRRSPDEDKASAVVDAFTLAWGGYWENAFPNDTLRPISNIGDNDRNKWGVTPIDALSTAAIMGQADIVQQILDFVPTINFTTTEEPDSVISVFETNIRYLAGLISGYDLLTGPYQDLAPDSDKVEVLLDQARILADAISFAFDTPSGVPSPNVYLNPEPRRSDGTQNGIAGIGTMILEWTRLSDLTGDEKYTQLVQRAQDYLLHPAESAEPFPGLIGTEVSLETGEFLDSRGGWSAGTDSFYEYLIKMYLYDPVFFEEYKDRWVLAADSTIEYLASHPSSRPELTFLAEFNGTTLTPSSGHLASFSGGNFILGGILLNEQKYIDFGINLTESYYATYEGCSSGIGPEGFRWHDDALPEGEENRLPPDDQVEFFEEAGFWVTSPYYILRPETLESLYYSYRATGDTKYQDLAWEGFQRIMEVCRAGSGFSGLTNVREADGGGYTDFMESFFLAETLKYAYLIFAEESDVQLKIDGPNGWVYNTEAHPVRVRG